MQRHRLRAVLTVAVLILSPVLMQPIFAQDADAPTVRPIPRLPNGEVSFEAPPGEKGVWNRGDYRAIIAETPEQTALRDGNRLREDSSGLKPKFSVDGTLEDIGSPNRTLSGSWSRGDTEGDFKLTRE